MGNITFHVDAGLHDRMKQHPEIKWSEIFRRSITDYLSKLETSTTITSRELWANLPGETKDIIKIFATYPDLDQESEFVSKMHEMDRKRGEDTWKEAQDEQ
jgi:hypothetical protein